MMGGEGQGRVVVWCNKRSRGRVECVTGFTYDTMYLQVLLHMLQCSMI